nr:sialidase family protein [uncultured Mucilaginibacter sp.]
MASRGWQGVPSVETSKNEIFASWYAGSKGEQLGNYVVLSTSSDDGTTWKNDELVIAPDNENLRFFDQALWKDKYGTLHLSWSVSEGYIINGASLKVWQIMIKRNSKNQLVISKPSIMFPGLMVCKPTFVGQDSSTMLFPMSGPNMVTTATSIGTPSEINGPFLYKATHDGSYLGPLSLFSKVNLDNSVRSYDEHMIVNIDDHNFLCAMRTTKGLYMTDSKDAGLTWSEAKKFTDIGPTPESRAYFGKLRSGNLLLVVNSSTLRENITAFISKDNGKTWPYSLVIDKRYGNSYPDVSQDVNGNIYIIFDYGRSPYGQIMFAKITEANIINSPKTAVPLITISKFK